MVHYNIKYLTKRMSRRHSLFGTYRNKRLLLLIWCITPCFSTKFKLAGVTVVKSRLIYSMVDFLRTKTNVGAQVELRSRTVYKWFCFFMVMFAELPLCLVNPTINVLVTDRLRAVTNLNICRTAISVSDMKLTLKRTWCVCLSSV